MSRWFRFYSDAVNDPKVQKLSGDAFKGWVNVLCLAGANDGVIPPLPDVSFALRVTEEAVTSLLNELCEKGLLDVTCNGYRPHNWSKRQFQTDTSNERVKRFRERHRNVTPTVTVTAPDTDTDTDTDTEQTQSRTEQKVSSSAKSAEKKDRKKPAKAITDDWAPKSELRFYARSLGIYDKSFDREMQKFRNHARQNDRRCVNWDMAAKNWLIKFTEINHIEPPRSIAEAKAAGDVIHVLEGTPEMAAWDTYYRKTTGMNAPRSKHGGIFPPTKLPPGHEEVA